jgi:phospholipase/carboxylesterase
VLRPLTVAALAHRRLFVPFVVCAIVLGNCAASSYAAPVMQRDGIRIFERTLDGITYYEAVPDDIAADTPLPMIVHFHGRASEPALPSRPFLGLETPVRVIFPRGPRRMGNGYTWLPVSAAGGESEALVKALETRGAEVAAFLRRVQQRHPTQGKPIVIGFSQGAMLTFALALEHPDVLAAAYPLAGYVPPARIPAGPRPAVAYPAIRAMHGTHDPVLRLRRTREGVQELQRRGFEIELHEFRGVKHEMSPRMYHVLKGWLRQDLHRQTIGSPGAGHPSS